jgi:hypothetical protein
LLLKLKKSYEPRKNHAPLASNVIEGATARLNTQENEAKQAAANKQATPTSSASTNKNKQGNVGGAQSSSGVDLFSSLRDSLMFESESAPSDQVNDDGTPSSNGDNNKKEGLSNLVMGVFSNPADGNVKKNKEGGEDGNTSRGLNSTAQKIISRPRRLSVEQVAAGEVEQPVSKSGANNNSSSSSSSSSKAVRSGSIFNSVIGMLDHETPFSMLTESQKKERLDARDVSSYIMDPTLDTSSGSTWIKVKDRVECFRELDTLGERAKLLETMNLDDAVLVLVELKLRGDYSDVLGAVQGKGALGAIKQKAKAAADNKPPQFGVPVDVNKMKGLRLLPPETAQIIACSNEAQMAKLLAGINLLRAATLLLEMRRRGSSGGVLDCLTPGGLAAILTHLPPPERAALLVSMAPMKCSEVLKAMNVEDQAMALSEMSRDEMLVAMSSLSRSEQHEANKALQAFKEKEAKKEAKKNKKNNKDQFGGFSLFNKGDGDGNNNNNNNNTSNSSSSSDKNATTNPADLINSTIIGGMAPKRRQSNFEALNRFATHADRRADIKKQEMIKEKAKEARENATRARAASAGGFKQVLYNINFMVCFSNIFATSTSNYN